MSSLGKYNLHYNPFGTITPTFNGNLVWAEMEEVKAKLERSYKECIQNQGKQIILNWGPYGGGKTFSAYYFSNQYKNEEKVTHLYIRCPKDGAKAVNEFVKGLIDALSFEIICARVREIIDDNSEEYLLEVLSPIAGREYAKAIALFGSEDDEVNELMNRFIYAGLTKTELKKLGLARDMKSDSDLLKFLSGVLSCFVGQMNKDYRLVLWIDEMEDLIYFSPKYYKTFSQILRDLFDSLDHGFLAFMNFTLAEGEDSTIELILGAAIWSRITKKIRYSQFEVSNAFQYAKELIDHAKVDVSNNQPFSKSEIELVVRNIPISSLTPREINKHFNSLLSYAIEHELSSIDEDAIKDWLIEYQEEN